jgi:flagellar basal body-associated protein FliL
MSELEQEQEQAEAPATKGKLTLIVMVVGALIGVGLGAMMLGPVAAPLFAGLGGGEEEGGGGGEHGEPPPVTIHVVENMVVNPAGSQGMRLLLTSIAIDVGDDTRMIDEIVAAELDLRGRFIHVFGRRTVSELSDVNLREEIKIELKRVTEDVLGKRVQRVFLPQFVLQ